RGIKPLWEFLAEFLAPEFAWRRILCGLCRAAGAALGFACEFAWRQILGLWGGVLVSVFCLAAKFLFCCFVGPLARPFLWVLVFWSERWCAPVVDGLWDVAWCHAWWHDRGLGRRGPGGPRGVVCGCLGGVVLWVADA
ncbi:hypothetical protein, partial [Streptomyces sp. JW3]|uniref:hypothetical protein n=1 Tax=Streptomyces sp. JW3 TaxID=3456955 RepID=UPI003FA4D3ED